MDVGGAEAEGVALSFSKGGGGKAGKPQARGRPVLNSQTFANLPQIPFNFSDLQNGCSCEEGPCPTECCQGAGPAQAQHFPQIRKG